MKISAKIPYTTENNVRNLITINDCNNIGFKLSSCEI